MSSSHPLPPSRRFAGRALVPLGLLLSLFAGGGCGDPANGGAMQGDAGGGGDPIEPGSREVQREIRDLITAVTPLPPTATPGEQGAWFPRRHDTIERLRAAGPETGREALRVYLERPDALDKVRVGLLDVAAHGAPERTRPILVALITSFGDSLELRTEACEILALSSPDTAVGVLGSILQEDRPRTTYPPTGRMMAAWILAMDATGGDQVELLAEIATDLLKDSMTRTTALRALGKHESPVGRKALETVLVESSGNHYLRRIATQSLATTIPGEEFCSLIRDVLAKEVDTYFQLFLTDTLEGHCR